MNFTLITGATGGIGKAFSYKLAESGCDLFLTGRSLEKLNKLKEDLSCFNVKILIFPCQLNEESSRKNLIEFIDKNKITVVRLINVAGVDTQKAFIDYTMEKLLFQMRVNVEATVSLTHEIIKRKTDKLDILTVSSMSGVSPMPYFALYSATKSMLTNFFTALHYELLKDNVKVTTVLPAGVYTRPDIINDIKGQGLWGKLTAKTPKYVAEKSLKALEKNKTTYIIGFFSKLLNFFMKFLPKKIVLKFIAKRWSKQTKDAF